MATHGGKRAGAGRPKGSVSTVPAITVFQTAAQPVMVEAKIADPLQYLSEVMLSSPDEKMRIEAAKAMLPYCHPKKGELGKKETQQQEAEQTQAASPYKAAQPPLRMVK